MDYLAHIAPDGRVQFYTEHADNTAALCSYFASAFQSHDHGLLVGQAHDIGKNSTAFQNRLMGGKKVDHATAGAIECAKLNHIYAACAVIGHHGGLPDVGNPATDLPGDPTCFGRLMKGLNGGIERYTITKPLPDAPSLPPFENDLLAMSFWTRMLYSCLVDADYLDTERFMFNNAVQRDRYDDLQTLLMKLEAYIHPWLSPKTELDRSRTGILKVCLDAGAKNKGLYTLTVPTGGGKTVASLAFALRHAVKHQAQRIIYVVPYTSVIEQNAEVFRNILGPKNVLEHHSGMLYDSDTDIAPEHRRLALATENWDAPVVVTTAVQFFESMYANRSSKCRKLHNICNSVLIFDEAQMIPAVHLQPCVAAIAYLVRHFQSTAVLCTATQPALNDLIEKFTPDLAVTEICPNNHELAAQFRRVTFRQMGVSSNELISSELSEHHQVLCIVNSRKAAQELYELLPTEGSFHLSTLMYPAHRQSILAEIRSRLSSGLPCRVVSTSLIEAGVDVDFPAVYRELSGLDSVLQAAGRCNRNGRKPVVESVVSIFERDTPPPVLFRRNIGAARDALSLGLAIDHPDTIQKYFRSLRDFMGEGTDKTATIVHLSQGISGCLLPFKTVAENFHLIDNNTKTVYIPESGNKEILQRILDRSANRADYRMAGRFGVAVYDQHYQALLSAGALIPLPDGESAVLKQSELYNESCGLSFQAK